MGQAHGDSKLCADLLKRQAVQSMQYKGLSRTLWQARQSMLQFAQFVQMQGLLLGGRGAGNMLVQ